VEIVEYTELLLLHPLTASSKTTWASPYREGKTSLDLNEAGDDGMAVASTGPYANNLHLTADR